MHQELVFAPTHQVQWMPILPTDHLSAVIDLVVVPYHNGLAMV